MGELVSHAVHKAQIRGFVVPVKGAVDISAGEERGLLGKAKMEKQIKRLLRRYEREGDPDRKDKLLEKIRGLGGEIPDSAEDGTETGKIG